MGGKYISKWEEIVDGHYVSRWLILSLSPRDLAAAFELAESDRDYRVPPDQLFIVSNYSLDKMIEYFSSSHQCVSLLERMPKTIFFCASISSAGHVDRVYRLDVQGDGVVVSAQPERGIVVDITRCVDAFDKSSALSVAPHGYCYKKSSGSYSSHFLRADRLLSDSSAVDMCAVAVRAWLANQRSAPIRRIYIDTSGIFSVAYALRGLLDSAAPPEIEIINYRGYEGLEGLLASNLDSSLVIVSASSSSGLVGRIQDGIERRRADANVLALVGLSGSSGSPLITVDRPQGFWSEHVPRAGMRVIDLVGEAFHPVINWKSQVIVLGEGHWKSYWGKGELRDVIWPLVERSALSLMKPGAQGVRDVFVDTRDLFLGGPSDNPFVQWALNHVARKAPHDLSAIVHFSEDGSKALAEVIRNNLVGKSAELISAEELALKSDLAGSVLVVAGVISRGSGLLSVSRHLRGIRHRGHRLYAIAGAFPESMEQYRLLTRNLERAPLEYPSYSVEHFMLVPRGPSSVGWWDNERALLESISDEDFAGRQALEFANERIAQLGRLGSKGFCESFVDFNSCALSLSEGFAPWRGSSKSGYRLQADVFLTVKAILQAAREDDRLESRLRIHNDTLVRGIIGPANFSRYNDGLIQSAILAAADPAELDYSDSVDMSSQFVRILVDVLTADDGPRGEGGYSMLLAMAVGKLRLCKTTRSRLEGLCSHIRPIYKALLTIALRRYF